MDVARTVKRKNAKKVMIIYRRAREQMPAEKNEIDAAMSEGIEFLFQTNIVRILGEKQVKAVECIKTELVKVDGDRERPVNIEGSNYNLEMDYVIMALGSKPQGEILDIIELERTDKNYIKTNENYQTSDEKIFASGDLIGTRSTVAWAARSGRDAAQKIEQYLN